MKMKVVKRGGSSELLDFSKIEKAVNWATEGLDVDPNDVIEKAKILFFNNMKTSDIQLALIDGAKKLISIECQDASKAAARLKLLDLYKVAARGITYPHLIDYITRGVSEKLLSAQLLAFDFFTLERAIKPERDLQFEYLGIDTLADRYLVRSGVTNGDEGSVIELPQHFFMRVSMGLALGDDVEDRNKQAIEYYEVLSQMDFMSSTPTLFNSGSTHQQLASCFLNTVADSITADEGDNKYASIFGTIEECAVLSKYAGGLGTDWNRVRGAGDLIKGTNGLSSGIVPYLKIYNDTAVAVNQGGKRKGSFAPYLEPWHTDFWQFCELKKNSGDERLRAHDIFPAAWMNDLLMERALAKQMWSFFSPADYPELHELHGAAFKRRYEQLESEDAYRSQMPAIDVWRKIITSLFETGHPWVTFKDECNRRNPQAHAGVIHSSNLCCVTADQRVVTERGMITVGDLYQEGGKNVVMGLAGPSNASVMLLPRPNAPIVQIETTEGYRHKVTPDHRVWKKDSGWIEAQELIAGDKILIQQSEGIFGEERNLELALVAGLIAGDGTYSDHSAMIDIWEGKTLKFATIIEKAVERLLKDNVELATTSTNNPKFSIAKDGKKARLSSAPLARLLETKGFNKETKLKVPEFVWRGDRSTVGAYLKGLYLTDGGLQVGKDACTLTVSSISKELLQDIQVLWANFGVKTSINKVHDGGERDFGKGGIYDCQPVWRLMITSIQGCKIAQRVTRLGDWREGETADVFLSRLAKSGYVQKMYATFAGLTPLPNEDAYCLTVDSETHAWTVNGLITHNTEITLNTSDDETAVCNLGSVNVSRFVKDGKLDLDRLRQVVRTGVRMLDNVIDINFYPSARAKTSNLKHRPIGQGIMGYHEYLVQRGVDFESQEHLEAADELYEAISYFAIEASADLAQERGSYPSFEGSTWSQGILPIDTANKKAVALTTRAHAFDWESLRAKVKRGMRNSNVMAIAPTATISNICGTTACVEPPFKTVYNKENLSGPYKLVDPSLRHGRLDLCKTAFEIDQFWVIKAAAVRQKWLDQAQSTNIWAKLGIKGSELSDIYMLAWELGLKTTYYLRAQSKEADDKPVVEAPVVVEEEFTAMACSIANGPNCEACQ